MKIIEVDNADDVPRPGNKAIVEYLKTLGLQVPDAGTLIGAGEEGEAYAFGKDKVIKIGVSFIRSDVVNLINMAKKVKGAQKSGAIARIYDFQAPYVLQDKNNEKAYVYWMIVERVANPLYPELPSLDPKMVDRLLDAYDYPERFQKLYSTLKTDEQRAEADRIADFGKRLKQTGLEFDDLHGDNVMVDSKGNLKVIDYGMTRDPEASMQSAIARLQLVAEQLRTADDYTTVDQMLSDTDSPTLNRIMKGVDDLVDMFGSLRKMLERSKKDHKLLSELLRKVWDPTQSDQKVHESGLPDQVVMRINYELSVLLNDIKKAADRDVNRIEQWNLDDPYRGGMVHEQILRLAEDISQMSDEEVSRIIDSPEIWEKAIKEAPEKVREQVKKRLPKKDRQVIEKPDAPEKDIEAFCEYLGVVAAAGIVMEALQVAGAEAKPAVQEMRKFDRSQLEQETQKRDLHLQGQVRQAATLGAEQISKAILAMKPFLMEDAPDLSVPTRQEADESAKKLVSNVMKVTANNKLLDHYIVENRKALVAALNYQALALVFATLQETAVKLIQGAERFVGEVVKDKKKKK